MARKKVIKAKKKIEMRTCDHCGEEFPESEMDEQAANEDYCVCPKCVECHEMQMIAMGERESEPSEEDEPLYWPWN